MWEKNERKQTHQARKIVQKGNITGQLPPNFSLRQSAVPKYSPPAIAAPNAKKIPLTNRTR
jgi:hypothetical protein